MLMFPTVPKLQSGLIAALLFVGACFLAMLVYVMWAWGQAESDLAELKAEIAAGRVDSLAVEVERASQVVAVEHDLAGLSDADVCRRLFQRGELATGRQSAAGVQAGGD